MKYFPFLFFFIWLNLSIFLTGCSEEEPIQYNVLFIAVDDLRPELNAYGDSQVISPNIDKLAEDGFIFQRAYSNVPVCGASRASLMTGLRPTSDKFRRYYARADEDAPGYVTLPQHFKNNGYSTISLGKIYHNPDDDSLAWDRQWRFNDARKYFLPENIKTHEHNQKTSGKLGPAWESADVDEHLYPDGALTDSSMAFLERLKDNDSPFFLAVGYVRPHLPFNAPQKYWDLYDSTDINLPDNYYRPENAPDIAIHNWQELRHYDNIPEEGPVSDLTAKKLIQGYYASTSFVDAQIGRLLKRLDELDLTKNTIIVLWGDHGWQLGEHSLWCKHANFETSLRTALILKTPNFKGGHEVNALTEFVDIYPTLSELANLDKPQHLEGVSFVPVLNDPELDHKDAIFARYLDGESIRTDKYLYTEWTGSEGNVIARMLYDHEDDPDENINVSEYPENAALVDSLSALIRQNISNRELLNK